MRSTTSQEDATLLDILIDGFEKNEILDGFHWRDLPMPDEDAAVRKFGALVDEARRWKGQPARLQEESARRVAAWPDLEVRQAGRVGQEAQARRGHALRSGAPDRRSAEAVTGRARATRRRGGGR